MDKIYDVMELNVLMVLNIFVIIEKNLVFMIDEKCEMLGSIMI